MALCDHPYVKSVGVYKCPSNTTHKWPQAMFPAPRRASFCGLRLQRHGQPQFWHGLWHGPGIGTRFGDSSPGITLAKIQSASNFIMMAETDPANNYGTEDVLDNNGAPDSGNGIYAGHTAFSNYLFSDGHVKPPGPSPPWTPPTATRFRTVNMWTYDSSAFTAANCTQANTNLAVTVNAYK